MQLVTRICYPYKYLSMTSAQSTSQLKMEVNSTYCGKSNQLDTCVYWGCPLVIQQNFGKIISFPNHPIKNICVIICPISLNNVFCTNAEQTCLSTSIMIVLFVKKNKITPTANLFLKIVSHFSLNSFQKNVEYVRMSK